MFEIVFSLMLRTVLYVHVNIILDFPITYKNVSVLCRSEYVCLIVYIKQ